jgi:hypothetical protein
MMVRTTLILTLTEKMTDNYLSAEKAGKLLCDAMKQYLELLKNAFALNSIMAIFDDDAHRIVSKRGEAILRDKRKI